MLYNVRWVSLCNFIVENGLFFPTPSTAEMPADVSPAPSTVEGGSADVIQEERRRSPEGHMSPQCAINKVFSTIKLPKETPWRLYNLFTKHFYVDFNRAYFGETNMVLSLRRYWDSEYWPQRGGTHYCALNRPNNHLCLNLHFRLWEDI